MFPQSTGWTSAHLLQVFPNQELATLLESFATILVAAATDNTKWWLALLRCEGKLPRIRECVTCHVHLKRNLRVKGDMKDHFLWILDKDGSEVDRWIEKWQTGDRPSAVLSTSRRVLAGGDMGGSSSLHLPPEANTSGGFIRELAQIPEEEVFKQIT